MVEWDANMYLKTSSTARWFDAKCSWCCDTNMWWRCDTSARAAPEVREALAQHLQVLHFVFLWAFNLHDVPVLSGFDYFDESFENTCNGFITFSTSILSLCKFSLSLLYILPVER